FIPDGFVVGGQLSRPGEVGGCTVPLTVPGVQRPTGGELGGGGQLGRPEPLQVAAEKRLPPRVLQAQLRLLHVPRQRPALVRPPAAAPAGRYRPPPPTRY